MKLELSPLFAKDFKAAYCYFNKEPRRVVILVRHNNTRTSMSYARYFMCDRENRFLNDNEHVDHIDNDCTNDDPDNLQILTPQQNRDKRDEAIKLSRQWVSLKCPACGIIFERKRNQTRFGGKPTIYSACSKKCSYEVPKMGLSKNELHKIGKGQLLKEYQILRNQYKESS